MHFGHDGFQADERQDHSEQRRGGECETHVQLHHLQQLDCTARKVERGRTEYFGGVETRRTGVRVHVVGRVVAIRTTWVAQLAGHQLIRIFHCMHTMQQSSVLLIKSLAYSE